MPEEAPTPSPIPEFPIQPSQQQVQQLSAALLVDSLSIMGLGVPSESVESGKLRSWLWDFHGNFEPELNEALGADALEEYSCRVMVLPSLEPASDLSPAALLAIRTRIYAVIGLVVDEEPSRTGDRLWGVYRQAIFAHNLLSSSRHMQAELRSVDVMIKLLQRHSPGRFPIGWNHGVTTDDIRDTVVKRLLHPEGIFRDVGRWLRVTKDKSLGPDLNSAMIDPVLARTAIASMIATRSKERHGEIQRTMSEIHALVEMEHELIEDSRIDSFCNNFRIGVAERFSLGSRGHLELGSALGTNADLHPITHDELHEIDRVIDQVASGNPPQEAEIPRGHNEVTRHKGDHSFEPITPSRAFIVWRGAPESAAEARRTLPRVLQATVRTAWLATFGTSTILEYFADQRYQEYDPEFRGAAIKSGSPFTTLSMPIAIHPEEFPVKDWMTFVLSQAIPGSAPTGSVLSFGINAVRLLNSADELLRADPGQSFACSMSAIEACIGGRGTDLSEKVSRRAARLLVPNPLMRAKAIDSFRNLYNMRSRVVHGDDCRVSQRQAVFMRYLASCVVYGLAGFARAAPRFGLPSTEDGIRKYLDTDAFTPGALMGAIVPGFANSVMCSAGPSSSWIQSS